MTAIQVIGGGVAGLVAAIEIAEAGARAVVHEASARLGGRAWTASGRYRANFGPHALYRHGAAERWLLARGLLPKVVTPRIREVWLYRAGHRLRVPLGLLPLLWESRREAPLERDFRSWAREQWGVAHAEDAVGLAALPSFHGDPGVLSAAFVQERLRRTLLRAAVYYVAGGWSNLIAVLAARARELGVELRSGSRVHSIGAVPAIVATDLRAAAKLLGDAGLAWPTPRTALLDVALTSQRDDPGAVLDLSERVYAARYSARDAALAPPGESLLQCVAGLRAGEPLEAALERVRALLDRGFAGWRSRCTWQHSALAECSGPVDLPGTGWRDRPAIARGGGVWLAGDSVAAPGILSEVCFTSAAQAACGALAELRG